MCLGIGTETSVLEDTPLKRKYNAPLEVACFDDPLPVSFVLSTNDGAADGALLVLLLVGCGPLVWRIVSGNVVGACPGKPIDVCCKLLLACPTGVLMEETEPLPLTPAAAAAARFCRAYSAFFRFRSIHCSGDSFRKRWRARAAFFANRRIRSASFANRSARCSGVSIVFHKCSRVIRIRSASLASLMARCSGDSIARRKRSRAALRARLMLRSKSVSFWRRRLLRSAFSVKRRRYSSESSGEASVLCMAASLLLLLPAELVVLPWPLRLRRAYSAFFRFRSIHCSGDSFSRRSFALAAFFANRMARCSGVSFALAIRIRSASFANRTALCSGVSIARRNRSLAALRACRMVRSRSVSFCRLRRLLSAFFANLWRYSSSVSVARFCRILSALRARRRARASALSFTYGRRFFFWLDDEDLSGVGSKLVGGAGSRLMGGPGISLRSVRRGSV
uniref:Uncharacterized protein n=1 Tax=Anopheles culicifacies TaxID=139723 RepID=A0A182MVH9_9DIPT